MARFSPLERPAAQRGSATVEFALLSLFFITFIVTLFEGVRVMYLYSSMAEMTRRAAHLAATANFTCPVAMAEVRLRAAFNSAAGLPMGGGVNGSFLDIDYLSNARVPASPMPVSPTQNIINCTTDPAAANCIRFVRVRLCQPGAASCAVPTVSYAPVFALGGMTSLSNMKYPTFATVKPVTMLGHGTPVACP